MSATRLRRVVTGPAVAVVSLVASIAVAEVIVRLFVVVRDVGPSFSTYDPVYGIRLKRGVAVRRITPEFVMDLSTNSAGYRGPEFRPSSIGRGSLVFLGDSFTMGYGVSDGLEYPGLIRARLSGRFGPNAPEVVNAGIGGTGNGHWLLFLTREAPAHHPRAVVLQVCSNDDTDNEREQLYVLDESALHLRRGDECRMRVSQRVQWVTERVPFLEHMYLYGLARQIHVGTELVRVRTGGATSLPEPNTDRSLFPVGRSSGSEPDSPVGRRAALTEAIVAQCVAWCRDHAWPVVLLLADLSAPARDRWHRFADLHAVQVLDMPDKRTRPDLYYAVDGHWNQSGHALAADIIDQWLQAQAVVGPRKGQ